MKNDDRYFRTSSFQCGSFLFAKGMELANIDKISNPKRASFVFVDTPEREELLRAFNYGKEGDPDGYGRCPEAHDSNQGFEGEAV